MTIRVNKFYFIYISLTILLFSIRVFAADAHHGGGLDAATIKTIVYQTINVGILVGALIYFLRKPTREFFAEKRASYLKEAQKAEAARRAAEEERQQIKARLHKLEVTADESISRARAEAAEMRNQMIAAAQALSQRIKEEARLSAILEVEKAKRNLREQMISEAIEAARQQMGTKVSVADHARLEGEFISNIQAVPR